MKFYFIIIVGFALAGCERATPPANVHPMFTDACFDDNMEAWLRAENAPPQIWHFIDSVKEQNIILNKICQ